MEIHRAAIAQDDADSAFSRLLDQVAWHQDEISMFGKKMLVPRLSAWYGDPGAIYTYSKIVMAGSMQAEWAHQVPKTKRPLGQRINLTFRTVSPKFRAID